MGMRRLVWGMHKRKSRRDACRRTSSFILKIAFSCACLSSGTSVSAEVGEQEGVGRRDNVSAQMNRTHARYRYPTPIPSLPTRKQ
jgi:hypothetical protein